MLFFPYFRPEDQTRLLQWYSKELEQLTLFRQLYFSTLNQYIKLWPQLVLPRTTDIYLQQQESVLRLMEAGTKPLRENAKAFLPKEVYLN